MIVVSDTSCISNLLSIGREELLPCLFGEVLIPPAVLRELLRFHVRVPDFVRCVSPVETGQMARLSEELDLGEAEAICLALELKADRLLIDEAPGRAAALREGIPIIGLVGVLVAAKRAGHLGTIGPVLRQLEVDAGFYLSASLKDDVLRAVGEAEPSK
jgi:predicted nucleic acid-binding protein